MAPNPLVRLVVRAERAASGPLNRATNSGEGARALLLVARAGRLAGDATARLRGLAVHVLDLPSHRDVQRLDAKVERLQRTLDELIAIRGDDEGAA
jgi:hypothetical protein